MRDEVRRRGSIRAQAAEHSEVKDVLWRCHCQNLRWVAVPSAAVEDEVRVFSEGIEHVPGWTRDGGHPRRHGPLPQDANFDEKLEGLSTPNDANGRRVFLPQAAD